MPTDGAVSLRARRPEDLDVLFRVAADLDTFEERDPASPSPMTRAEFDAARGRDRHDRRALVGGARRRIAPVSASIEGVPRCTR